MLDNHIFSIILDIRFKTLKQLLIEGIYIYVGQNWIITLHSSEVKIFSNIKDTLEKKNTKLLVENINALYYTIIDEIISRYEQLLTWIALQLQILNKNLYIKNLQKICSIIGHSGKTNYSNKKTFLVYKRHYKFSNTHTESRQ